MITCRRSIVTVIVNNTLHINVYVIVYREKRLMSTDPLICALDVTFAYELKSIGYALLLLLLLRGDGRRRMRLF